MSKAWVLLLYLHCVTSYRDFKLFLYKNKYQTGKHFLVHNFKYNEIRNIDKDHQNVKSFNTYNDCFVLYSEENGKGNKVFVYGVSLYHYDLEKVFGKNLVKSVSVCELEESRVCRLCDYYLAVDSPEYNFWVEYIKTWYPSDLERFKANIATDRYIYWDFQYKTHPDSPTPARDYQRALEWAVDTASFPTLTLNPLTEILKLAKIVYDFRKKNFDNFDPSTVGTEPHAIAFEILALWKYIVEAYEEAIKRKEGEEMNKSMNKTQELAPPPSKPKSVYKRM